MPPPKRSSSRTPRARPARWTLYLLRCADGTLYTGITNALDRRLERYGAGTASKYTRSRRPVTLVWSRACRTGRQARVLEYAVKCLSREEKLRLIEGRLRL